MLPAVEEAIDDGRLLRLPQQVESRFPVLLQSREQPLRLNAAVLKAFLTAGGNSGTPIAGRPVAE